MKKLGGGLMADPMNRFHVVVSAAAIFCGAIAGIAGSALLNPAPAHADGVDCYTQDTYNGGTRTTCYYGYPDHQRSITECDATHCRTTWQ
jgi:hypothetical protein